MHLFTSPRITLCIAAAILVGIIVHDTKVDSLVKAAVVPVMALTAELSISLLHAEAHTHVERVSVQDVSSQSNQLFSRRNLMNRYLLQKNVPRGHHAFDNYNLPVVS